jgi:hypothetical protein
MMPLIVYMDETGDHTLELVDKDYPIFGLVMVIYNSDAYADKIVPSIYRLKIDFFGHEGIVLRSYDIRKQKGPYAFLSDAMRRNEFYSRINAIMGLEDYTLIASMIRKQHHKDRYGEAAANPYDLAMEFALERLLPLLEKEGQTEVYFMAEARGKKEDDQLSLSFYRFVNEGNVYVSADRVKRIQFRLTFRSKEINIVGMQTADLATYPTARHIIDPSKPNPAYDILRPRFYIGPGPGLVRGLKVFP